MVLPSEASSGPVAKVPVTASGVVAILTIGYIGLLDMIRKTP